MFESWQKASRTIALEQVEEKENLADCVEDVPMRGSL